MRSLMMVLTQDEYDKAVNQLNVDMLGTAGAEKAREWRLCWADPEQCLGYLPLRMPQMRSSIN